MPIPSQRLPQEVSEDKKSAFDLLVAASAEDYSVTFFWGLAGLEKLSADRDRLARSLDPDRLGDFLDWYTCYLDVYVCDPENVFFCVVWRQDRAVAILPMRLARRWFFGFPTPVLEMLNALRMPTGDSIVTDDSDPQWYAPLLLRELLNKIRPRWHCLRLVNVYGNCAFASALARGLSHRRIWVSGADWCPIVPENQLQQRVGKKFARKLRQNRKRLAETGTAAFSTVWTLPELEQAYEEFLQVEAAGWKGEKGTRTALLFDKPMMSFYRQLMHRLADRGRCVIHMLHVDGQPVAGGYGIVTADTVYGIKIGYDIHYARLSPGVLLQDYIFRWCADRPSIKSLNFTTDMPWMMTWRPTRDDVYDLVCFRGTFRGRLARLHWRLADLVRYYRRTWIGPLYRRLFGTSQERYKRKLQEETDDAE